MPMVRVRLFAALRELAGTATLEVAADDIGSLLEQLSQRLGPEFDRVMSAGAVVVDGATVSRDHVLSAGDDVALLPPVSGGAWAHAHPGIFRALPALPLPSKATMRREAGP